MAESGWLLYLRSLALFWGSTIVMTLLDYFIKDGAEYAGSSAPVLFPNLALGVLLLPIQLVAGLLLLLAAFRMTKVSTTPLRAAAALLFCVFTGMGCFAIYAVFTFWYLMDVMHYSL